MILTKILGGLCLLGLISSLSLGILYQSSQNQLESLQSKYTQSQSLLKDCSESKEKLTQSKQATEEVMSNQQTALIALEKDKGNLLVQLDNIPKKGCPKPASSGSTGSKANEIEYVDIDAPYTDGYLGVFKQLSKDKRNPDTP